MRRAAVGIVLAVIGCVDPLPPPQGVPTTAGSASATAPATYPTCKRFLVVGRPPPDERVDRWFSELKEQAWLFKACDAMAMEVGVTGTVVIEASIDSTGTPHPRVNCSTMAPRVADCVVEAFAQVHFTPPPAVPEKIMAPFRYVRE